jgi:hypothetical protein
VAVSSPSSAQPATRPCIVCAGQQGANKLIIPRWSQWQPRRRRPVGDEYLLYKLAGLPRHRNASQCNEDDGTRTRRTGRDAQLGHDGPRSSWLGGNPRARHVRGLVQAYLRGACARQRPGGGLPLRT